MALSLGDIPKRSSLTVKGKGKTRAKSRTRPWQAPEPFDIESLHSQCELLRDPSLNFGLDDNELALMPVGFDFDSSIGLMKNLAFELHRKFLRP